MHPDDQTKLTATHRIWWQGQSPKRFHFALSLIIASLIVLLTSTIPGFAQSAKPLILNDDKGVLSYKLESSGSGGTLVGANGKEAAAFNRKDESKRRVLQISANKVAEGFIASKHSGKWEIYDRSNTLQYVFKQEEEGYKLKGADEATIYRVKNRPYGLELEDAANNSMCKIRLETGTIRVKNAQGKVVFTASEFADPLMISCFGMERLSRAQQAALACALATMR